MMMESNEDYLTEEMEKQKKKLRDISNVLDTQHQLLRLIIQVGGNDRGWDENLIFSVD